MQLCHAGGQARGRYGPLQTLVGRVGASTLLHLQADAMCMLGMLSRLPV